MIKKKGHWEALIIELGGPNYAKLGVKMTNLEGDKIDVSDATGKGPNYRYFGVVKFLPDIKELFDNPP